MLLGNRRPFGRRYTAIGLLILVDTLSTNSFAADLLDTRCDGYEETLLLVLGRGRPFCIGVPWEAW